MDFKLTGARLVYCSHPGGFGRRPSTPLQQGRVLRCPKVSTDISGRTEPGIDLEGWRQLTNFEISDGAVKPDVDRLH